MVWLPRPSWAGRPRGPEQPPLAPVSPPIPPCPGLVTLPGDIMLCRGGPSLARAGDSPYSHANCPPSPLAACLCLGPSGGAGRGPQRPPLSPQRLSPSSRHSGMLGMPWVPSPVTSPVGRHFQAKGHLEVHELLPVLQHLGDLRPQALLLLLQGLHRQLRAVHGEGVRGAPAGRVTVRWLSLPPIAPWGAAGTGSWGARFERCGGEDGERGLRTGERAEKWGGGCWRREESLVGVAFRTVRCRRGKRASFPGGQHLLLRGACDLEQSGTFPGQRPRRPRRRPRC